MQHAAVAVVFVATVLCLYTRPFGARDWHVAAAGAAAAWLLGPLSVHDGLLVIRHSWNIVAFFTGLMLLGAGAEWAGLYTRVAAALIRASDGRPRVVRTLLIGTGITAILSNDATPLVLTPTVFAAASSVSAAADTAFATTFIADSASLLLPVSNPVNLLFYDRFGLSLRWYAVHVLPAAIAAVIALATVLAWKSPRAEDHPAATALPLTTVPAAVQRTALLTFVILAVAYLVAAVLDAPLGLITLSGGAALLIERLAFERKTPAGIRKHISVGLLVFVVSLLVLVESVSRAGLLDHLANGLSSLGDQPVLVAIAGAALIAAVLSNLVNNWPAALLIAATISVSGGDQQTLVVGSLIGCEVGANFTMVGSLSTVFWQTLARQRGAAYSPSMYARRAFVPTLAAITAACLVAAALS